MVFMVVTSISESEFYHLKSNFGQKSAHRHFYSIHQTFENYVS